MDQFNAVGRVVEFIHAEDLVEHQAYELILIARKKTKFGNALAVTIKYDERVGQMFLPKRYNDASDEVLKKMNTSSFKLGLVFLGMKNQCQEFVFVNIKNYNPPAGITPTQEFMEEQAVEF